MNCRQLHELVPAVISCMVSKQLCLRPEVDNHWALRDFSARLIAQLCKNYHTTTNAMQTRVTRLCCRALANDKSPLASFYGALVGKCFNVSALYGWHGGWQFKWNAE